MKRVNAISVISLLTLTAGCSKASDRVYFEKDEKLPLVQMTLISPAGALRDGEIEGLSNLTGEMLLRGTKRLTKDQIDDKLDELAVSIEVEPRLDSSLIQVSLLAKSLPEFLPLLEEILTEPRFEEVEFQKIKTQLESAVLSRQAYDSALAGFWFNRLLFGDHPYQSSLIGTAKTLKRVTLGDVEDFYRTKFRVLPMELVASGDSNRGVFQAFLNRIDTKFGIDTAKAREVDPELPQTRNTSQILFVQKPGRTQASVTIGQIGTTFSSPNYPALFMGNYAFGGGHFGSILMQEIRVKRGWSYGVGSQFKNARRPHSWSLRYSPALKDLKDSLFRVLELVDELKSKGLSPEQFDSAKSSFLNTSGFFYNTAEKRAQNQILEKALDLKPGAVRALLRETEHIMASHVNAAMNDYLKPNELSIVIVGATPELERELESEWKKRRPQSKTSFLRVPFEREEL